MEIRDSSASDQILLRTVTAEIGQVREIRVTHYPHIHRAIFRLPELPGLPEENRGLDNLFDARIPCMRFRYEHEWRSDVSQLIGMELPPIALSFPNALFPLMRTNTTPRALLEEMLAYRTNPDQNLAVDPAENTIKIQKSPLLELLDRLKKLVPGP